MIVASIDVETSGLDPATSDLLSVGLVIFNTNTTFLAPIITQEWLVDHDHIKGHPIALKINANLIQRISNNEGTGIQTISRELYCYLEQRNCRLTFAGKNFSSFDNEFLKRHMPQWSDIRMLGGHRTLDPGSMFAIASDVVPPDLKTCCERAGVIYNSVYAHSALYDANLVAQCIFAFLKGFK